MYVSASVNTIWTVCMHVVDNCQCRTPAIVHTPPVKHQHDQIWELVCACVFSCCPCATGEH